MTLARDSIEYTKDISSFITVSAKRESVFQQAQLDLGVEEDEYIVNTHKLKTLCPTRWTVRVKSVNALLWHYVPLRNALATIASQDRSECGTKASGFF